MEQFIFIRFKLLKTKKLKLNKTGFKKLVFLSTRKVTYSYQLLYNKFNFNMGDTMRIFSIVLFCFFSFCFGGSQATSEDLLLSGSDVLNDKASALYYSDPTVNNKKIILYEPERRGNPCDVVWSVPFFLMTPVDKMVVQMCGYLYPNHSKHDSGIIIKAEEIALNDYLKGNSYHLDNVEVVVETRFPYFQEDEDLFPSDQNLFVYRKQGKVEVRFSLLRVDVIY